MTVTSPHWSERLQTVAGNLARPVSVVLTSASVAVTPVIIVARMAPDRFDLIGAAAFVGAGYAGLAGLYWGKAWENKEATKHEAQVKVAEANAAAPPATPPADPTLYGGPRE